MPGGTVSAITALQSLLVPALAAATGRRPTVWQIAAGAVGMAGVAALVLPHGHVVNTAGVMGAAVLAISAAIGMMLTTTWAVPDRVHHLTATAWQMLAGGVLLLPAAVIMEGAPPAESVGEVAVSVWLSLVATAAAFGLFFGGLHRGVPPATVSLLALASPVVSTALGWIVAAETLTAGQMLGVVAVLAALVLGRPRHARSDPHEVDHLRQRQDRDGSPPRGAGGAHAHRGHHRTVVHRCRRRVVGD
jgi:probable blue pigment (indigoidine) exporter